MLPTSLRPASRNHKLGTKERQGLQIKNLCGILAQLRIPKPLLKGELGYYVQAIPGQCFCYTHPSNAKVTLNSRSRSMKNTLQSKHLETVRPFLTDKQLKPSTMLHSGSPGSNLQCYTEPRNSEMRGVNSARSVEQPFPTTCRATHRLE